jgi:hypothetical protein
MSAVDDPSDPASPNVSAGLREAATALSRAAGACAADTGPDVSQAEELIEQARSELIDWLRKDPGDPQSYHWKALLTQLNRILPLIESAEKRGDDSLRRRIAQALETLENLF